MMTYDEALEYIHTISWRGSKRGLSRTEALLAKVGSPERRLKFVHVAGTNGKGSTCACIESVLRKAGYRTGLYTSPFIARFNERIQVDGKCIGDMELAELVEELRPLAEEEADKPTEFELITVLGMMYFDRRDCDVVVLEVGMGGEFDSTNVIPGPEVAVITALGLDHTAHLGPDITDIARAKAGIIKKDCDVVIYGAEPSAEKVIEDRCALMGARLHRTDMAGIEVTERDLTGSVFSLGELRDIRVGLAGDYQPRNAAVALTTLRVLRDKGWRIPDEAIRAGLAEVRWPGRFELLRRDPVVLLDGAHNPHGVTAAVESIREFFPDKKVVVLTGVMADKDVSNMIQLLLPVARCFVTVTPDNHRSLPAEEYAGRIREAGGEAFAAPSIPEGVRMAVELAGRDGVVCALGSLYSSQDVKEAVAALDK